MSLGETGEHVLGRPDPVRRHPGDVRHDARVLKRLSRRSLLRAQLAQLVLELGDRRGAQCRLHERPSRLSNSSAATGPRATRFRITLRAIQVAAAVELNAFSMSA